MTAFETLSSLIGHKYNPDVFQALWQKYSLCSSHNGKASPLLYGHIEMSNNMKPDILLLEVDYPVASKTP